MNKKTIFLILLAVILVPSFCFAQANTIDDVIKAAVNSLIPIVGGLSTIAFIVAGIMFLSASGNPSRMTIAKGSLIAAVIGIVIVVLASGAKDFVSTFFGLTAGTN